MTEPCTTPASESLDPENWDAIRHLGHQMLDDMFDYMSSVSDRPAWTTVPAQVRHALDGELPLEGSPLADVYEEFRENILPYPTGNQHPGFFGWVMGNGTATGMLADMLASGMNPHLAGYDQSAALVERKTVEWLSESLGYPTTASGLLVSGGTMANLNGLAVARQAKAGFDIRQYGQSCEGAPQLTVYGSRETHNWILKACELMGLGRNAFRAVPVDSRYQIDAAACRTMIRDDIEKGFRPFCLLGTIGTVNTGAMDDIAALRDIADEFDIWLHVDGAFGSLAAWAPDHPGPIDNQSLADSIAFDLHKWGYMPYDVGCILTRHADAQNETFNQSPGYLTSTPRGPAVETTYFADKGIQLSRSFRALKIWMSLKEQGIARIGRVIQKNIGQAGYLSNRIIRSPNIELAAPTSLNVVCFNVTAEGMDGAALNRLNEEILLRIQESGIALPSHAILNGQFVIRACITNHRTQNADLDRLVDAVLEHRAALLPQSARV